MLAALIRIAFLRCLMLVGLAWPAAATGLPETGLTERVVIDQQSGLAIHGYDPVAYVSEGRPVPGRDAHQVVWSDATWRFMNGANAALFRDHPERYAPRLGGYDPVIAMQGHATPGNPHLFRIRAEGLYLFSSAQNMTRFNEAYDLHALERAWQDLRGTLAP